MNMLDGNSFGSKTESSPPKIEQGPKHFWFMYGIKECLVPRLEEIKDAEELVDSESTLELIEKSFKDNKKVDLNDLTLGQLYVIADSMPLILEDLRRLNYPLLEPEIFACAEAYASKIEKAIEERSLASRGEVGQVLKG
jgi:hypothetical protein